MAATTFGVVCSAGSKMIRRIILPHADQALIDGTHAVANGEELHVFADQVDTSITACETLVQAKTGVAPSHSRCAVVDKTNTVVAMIHADPTLDVHPAGQLILSYDGVGIGCTWDSVAQLFSTPSLTFLPGTSRIGAPGSALNTVTVTILPRIISRSVSS